MRNEFERLRGEAEFAKKHYPPGTRIELNNMSDPWNPVPSGTRGTVTVVDDIGQVHMKWDNGRTLPLNISEDSFRKLTEQEVAEEKAQAMSAPQSGPKMSM